MPSLAVSISRDLPELEPELVHEHISRLSSSYLTQFDEATITRHLRCIHDLARQPAGVILAQRKDGSLTCTVVAQDRPFEFSLITGVLAANGFEIEGGEVFTLDPLTSAAEQPKVDQPFNRRTIIDHFIGRLREGLSFHEAGPQIRSQMLHVFSLLADDSENGPVKARRFVNELICGQLRQWAVPERRRQPVDIQIRSDERNRTVLRITGADTPAFLYSLSTALSLHELSIEHVRIGTNAQGVQDDITVVDRHGQGIVDPQMVDRIRVSVLLTKEFVYFIDAAPDPYTAVMRFEQLAQGITQSPQQAQWIDLLSEPQTLRNLARLLGTSDFLWDDFIHAHYDALLDLFQYQKSGQRFAGPTESIAWRMETALADATSLEHQIDALNQFKDEEIFRIDLDHILTPYADFRELSRHLTLLAENLIARAAKLIHAQLLKDYGQPCDSRGDTARFAVFGLGKLGGVALGYASDIELLFIHRGEGQTTGGTKGQIANQKFFDDLARMTADCIRSKHEGIFEVDLRLRPYGQNAPLSNPIETFAAYFDPAGDAHQAHPLEMVALTRLRWLAGDAQLGFDIERLRDSVIYDRGQFDMDRFCEAWHRQHRQKNKSGRFNAKYSPGALVDLELAVQLMQITHANAVPQLRTPQIRLALQALRRAEVIEPHMFARIVSAYYFFRQLINALRMHRGNAQDLFMPPADHEELIHLARRMYPAAYHQPQAGEKLLEEFEQHTHAVKAFVEAHLSRQCPDVL